MADRNKNAELFRQKSLDRVSSPENLDKYIKATTPSLWLLLGSIIILLIGVLVWASVGKIPSYSDIGIRIQEREMVFYIQETDQEKLCDESYVQIGDVKYEISSVTGPELVNASTDTFLMDAAGLKAGDWYYVITCRTGLRDGQYKGKIVFEKISPIHYIIN